jgi:hypothetical protein
MGDCGKEEGYRLLSGPYRKDLDCDYIQMAHHGQQGVSKNFYRTVKFNACLWPTISVGKDWLTSREQAIVLDWLFFSVNRLRIDPGFSGTGASYHNS